MLKILQIGIGTAVAFLVSASGENLVTATMIGLLASLAVARAVMWRQPIVWDAQRRTWHFGEPISAAPVSAKALRASAGAGR